MASTPQVVKPAPLRPGDKVGIVAPASPFERDLLEGGCNALRAMGYEPVYDASILDTELYFAGSVERRARELEGLFVREDVRGILCARGGYGCNYLLPHVDLDLICRHPKVFVGYSDVTTLLTWLHDAAGLVTFHGPMVTKDFVHPQGVDLDSWESAMSGGSWNSPELVSIVPGEAHGRLYGGCLSMLTASLGTPYEIRTDGTILFIEDVAAKPYQIDRMLMHLRLAGKLRNVQGIVFGTMQECLPAFDAGYSLVDVVRRVVGDLGIPVAFGLNSGHVACGNVTLPIGVQASLTVDEESAQLTVLEAAVELSKV